MSPHPESHVTHEAVKLGPVPSIRTVQHPEPFPQPDPSKWKAEVLSDFLAMRTDCPSKYAFPAVYCPPVKPRITTGEQLFLAKSHDNISDIICDPMKNLERSLDFDTVHVWYLFRTGKIPIFVFNYLLKYVPCAEHLSDMERVNKVLVLAELVFLKKMGQIKFNGPYFYRV